MLLQKEREMLNEVQQLENNAVLLEKQRKEEIDRVNNAVQGMNQQQKMNVKVNEKLIQENAERLANLKMRREM